MHHLKLTIFICPKEPETKLKANYQSNCHKKTNIQYSIHIQYKPINKRQNTNTEMITGCTGSGHKRRNGEHMLVAEESKNNLVVY